MIKKSRQGAETGFTGVTENENCEKNLAKYFFDGGTSKRKKHSAIDLILEDKPHLREYARQRALVGQNMKRRMLKSFKKAGSLTVKNLARQSKISKA